MVCLDEGLIAYANSAGQANTILVGLDTDNPATSGALAEETFYSLGQAAMNSVAQSVYSQFAAMNESLGGFAINNYRDSYLNGQLKGWPTTNPVVTSPVPQFTASSVSNNASFSGGSVAPGELVAIFGSNLGPAAPQVLQVANGEVTTNLGRVQVLFDGTAAPMVLASSGQISAIVPFEVTTNATTAVQVVYGGATSATAPVSTATAAPGIFTGNAEGTGKAAALNQDYSYNGASNPAAAGTAVLLYLTGAGAMTPTAVDGSVNGDASLLSEVALPVTAEIGGVPATVLYAGSSVGIVSGVVQVNVLVPSGLASGAQAVTVVIGGVATQAGLRLRCGEGWQFMVSRRKRLLHPLPEW